MDNFTRSTVGGKKFISPRLYRIQSSKSGYSLIVTDTKKLSISTWRTIRLSVLFFLELEIGITVR